MAKRQIERRIDLFGLDIHVSGAAIADYAAFFRQLRTIPVVERVWRDEDRLLILHTIRVSHDGRRVQFVALDTDDATSFAVYNQATGRLRLNKLPEASRLVHKTHAVLKIRKADRRRVSVEYNHRGAKAIHIEALLRELGRTLPEYADVDVAIKPVPAASFAEAVRALSRITSANVVIARPNINWDAEYSRVMDGAAESGAQRAEIEYQAPRSGSLEKTRGVIKFLLGLADNLGSMMVKDARVDGKTEEGTRKRVFLRRNLVKKRAVVDRMADGGPAEPAILSALEELADDES